MQNIVREEPEPGSDLRWWHIFRWIALLLVIQLSYCVLTTSRLPLDDAANLGEMFGALEVFFSGLGFGALILTIRAQGRDALASRKRQIEQAELMSRQVELLREESERQRLRDEIDAGPFFRLVHDVFTQNLLQVSIANLGAPVICLDLTSLTPGARVHRWSPDTLPTEELLKIEVQLEDPQQRLCAFHLLFRDRRGQQRAFALEIDRRPVPAKFSFGPAPTIGPTSIDARQLS